MQKPIAQTDWFTSLNELGICSHRILENMLGVRIDFDIGEEIRIKMFKDYVKGSNKIQVRVLYGIDNEKNHNGINFRDDGWESGSDKIDNLIKVFPRFWKLAKQIDCVKKVPFTLMGGGPNKASKLFTIYLLTETAE